MEKTRIPSGSRRRRPTGNLAFKRFNFHATNLFVVQTISVQSKSNAESTNDAINDSEDEKYAAMHFAASSKTFATTLVCHHHVSNTSTPHPKSGI